MHPTLLGLTNSFMHMHFWRVSRSPMYHETPPLTNDQDIDDDDDGPSPRDGHGYHHWRWSPAADDGDVATPAVPGFALQWPLQVSTSPDDATSPVWPNENATRATSGISLAQRDLRQAPTYQRQRVTSKYTNIYIFFSLIRSDDDPSPAQRRWRQQSPPAPG